MTALRACRLSLSTRSTLADVLLVLGGVVSVAIQMHRRDLVDVIIALGGTGTASGLLRASRAQVTSGAALFGLGAGLVLATGELLGYQDFLALAGAGMGLLLGRGCAVAGGRALASVGLLGAALTVLPPRIHWPGLWSALYVGWPFGAALASWGAIRLLWRYARRASAAVQSRADGGRVRAISPR
jgi:hypothetical protein